MDSAKLPEYPGWNLELYHTDRGTSTFFCKFHCYSSPSWLLCVRETAMMMVMDLLTDKPDWHIKVFDDEIAEKWRQEALAWPDADLMYRFASCPAGILDRESVDFCILELRDKAEHFRRTGITPTLDASFTIAKSDTLVPRELHAALREAFARLQVDNSSRPDWHPWTNETVQDLVHPSMYPLVYGRSLFLPEEVVGVEDAVDQWAGKGEAIPRPVEWDIGENKKEDPYWSTNYQWLPANLKFTADGGVQFTSYINNLHPAKYADIYKTLGKLIEKALPMWDQCLCHADTGRTRPRIVDLGLCDDNAYWEPPSASEMLARERAAEAAATRAKHTAKQPRVVSDDNEGEDSDSTKESDEDESEYESEPEPNDADYEEWKYCRQALHPPPPAFGEARVDYTVDPAKTLRESFKDTGLQIIVKMASIELTPEKPAFASGGWHVEGQMNEHIVGTLLYYLDSENITDSHLDFRAITSDDQSYVSSEYRWMESVCGASFSGTYYDEPGDSCLQTYGRVSTPQGRLLAFPNDLQHRVSGFRLRDPTKPGHRRFIALWLVDPRVRIISTANVPPQQAEWWFDNVFGGSLAVDDDKIEGGSSSSVLPPEITQLLLERGIGKGQLAEAVTTGKSGGVKLPPEVLNMIRNELNDWNPMTREEAEGHRLGLMEERSASKDKVSDHWDSITYSFCEH
ncbi:hypothetical protein C8A05DRAFT_13257 [Staphylotrichum tortipilum]|uniref:Uncharacterized protein n=1 Tax=Staphylotrichum tortipilum TaxID=2831512 RepID=A0AAN6RVE2_9PEZI|nr:hypothetical protein C8A05DRAFT_13257 [Staphylotrichum longicolle]